MAPPRTALAAALLAALLPATALANRNGSRVGRATTGCGGFGCHAMNPGASVSIAGPMSVAAGSRSTYTLTIRSTFAGFMAGGLDVAAQGATLAVNPAQTGTRVNGADLVHNAPIAAAGGAVTVRFDLVAPAAAGTVTLTAAGNAVNLSNSNSGDAWAIAAPLAVTVTAGAAPDAAVTPDAAVAPDAAGTPDAAAPEDAAVTPDAAAPPDVASRPDGDGTEDYDPTGSYAYGRCAASPGAARGTSSLAALALLAAAALRRRGRRP